MMLHRLRYVVICTLATLACLAGVNLDTSSASGFEAWSGAGTGVLSNEWAAISNQEHCAQTTSTANTPDHEIFPVADSRFAKGSALEFLMGSGPACFSGRDELAQANPYSSTKVDRRFYSGNDYWLAWQAVFPPSYFASGSDGNGMMQIHRPCNGKSPFGIGGQSDGKLIVYWINSSGAFIETPVGPKLAPETVYSFVVRYVARNTTAGSWQVWESVGGGPLTEVLSESGIATILPGSCGPESAFATIGIYSGFVKAGLEERIGGYNVAGTREAAELAAFGPTVEPTPPPEAESDTPADEVAEAAVAKSVSDATTSLTDAQAALRAAEASLAQAKLAEAAVKGA